MDLCRFLYNFADSFIKEFYTGMISILIPIYNQDVRPLVYTLAKQCSKLGINFQILCFDDGSEAKYRQKNKELAFVFGVNYTEMEENLGRSRIRNWLGNAAYYPFLLFLDGDSKVNNKNFVKQYIKQLSTDGIIYGGRTYTKRKPTNKKKILHWKYGTYVESMSAKRRKKDPYLNFMSNNFIIPQEIFKECRFDENTKGYGFEDLQYAKKLQQMNFAVCHIDNPVLHDGIESNTIFLKKTEEALKNLIMLEDLDQIPQTRLLRSSQWLKSYGLTGVFMKVMHSFEARVREHLLSSEPWLWVLQLWKLYRYLRLRTGN